MRKSIALPIGGIIIFTIFIAAVSMISFTVKPTKTYLTFQGEVAMSAMNEAYLARKNVDQGSYYIAQRAAYELGKEGGGVSTWTADNPTDIFIESELIDKINSMLPSGKVQGSYPERNIEWNGKNLNITKSDEYFQVSGKQDFTLTDTRINLELKSSVPFDQRVDSSYFNLINFGRKIFTDSDYSNITNSGKPVSEIASDLKDKFSADYSELEFDISADGNDINIKITDTSCDCSNEIYCLAPLKEGEMIDKAISCGGKEIPFGYMELVFRITVAQPLPF